METTIFKIRPPCCCLYCAHARLHAPFSFDGLLALR